MVIKHAGPPTATLYIGMQGPQSPAVDGEVWVAVQKPITLLDEAAPQCGNRGVAIVAAQVIASEGLGLFPRQCVGRMIVRPGELMVSCAGG